jgi:DNA polymerase/3'-5' exonuclease PolX
MSAGPKLPLDKAEQVASKLQATFAPACDRLAVAGSIRRGVPEVGDVELVAIPNHQNGIDRLTLRLNALVEEQKIYRSVPPGIRNRPAWGDRYKKFWCWTNDVYGWVQVDLFITTPESWGAILAIRTGPSDFSKALVTHIKYRTPYRQEEGVLVRQVSGEVVPVPEEKDYFRLAGLPWIEPPRRTVAALRRVQKG